MTEFKEKPINLVKIVTEELAPSVMRKLDLEITDDNYEDVLALALNSLPAKYVATARGKQYAELIEVYRLQYETDVIAALTRAVIKVRDNPRSVDFD